MLEIKLFNRKKLFTGVLITGHADFCEPGYDIVCAGVSTLSMSLVNFLNTTLEISIDDLNYFSIENEESSVFSNNVENPEIYNNNEFQIGFKFFDIGIKSLLQDYSDYIKLIYQEV